MDTVDAVRRMVDQSGMSAYEVSRSMGRARSYLSVLTSRRSEPTAATLASIAKACGYDLQLVGHGETITLGDDGEGDGQARAWGAASTPGTTTGRGNGKR